MICYRDMTFCTFYESCADAKDCNRPLTPEVQAEANKWWESFNMDSGTPICMFMEHPECWKKK